jgi:hypothetical protein
MNVIRKLLTTGAAVLALAGLTATTAAAAAQASGRPIIYSGLDGWHSNGHLPKELVIRRANNGKITEKIARIHWARYRPGLIEQNAKATLVHEGHRSLKVEISFAPGATGGGVSTHKGRIYYTQTPVDVVHSSAFGDLFWTGPDGRWSRGIAEHPNVRELCAVGLAGPARPWRVRITTAYAGHVDQARLPAPARRSWQASQMGRYPCGVPELAHCL